MARRVAATIALAAATCAITQGAPTTRHGVARPPTPAGVFLTSNARESAALSRRIAARRGRADGGQSVATIGGGLSGLACAKYLADAGHVPTVYEARGVLGGKVSAWKDPEGDWVETGLHVFFGAYPNMLNLMKELRILDRLQWKAHRMAFALRNTPGRFTAFEFTPGVPAPFGMALAILRNRDMMSLWEKLRVAPPLVPMLLGGQRFIDAQDELSVTDFMRRWGMPERVNKEIFIAMGKALDFMDPERLSMSVILTAMNRFINEADGSQTAFLDGNQPERLCAPLENHVRRAGGDVRTGCPVRAIRLDADGAVEGLDLDGGETVTADWYVSAVPVDVFKRLAPKSWRETPFFSNVEPLRGIPVINVQLWLDRKLATSLDGLAFSRSPLLSVYADMSRSCEEYANDSASMLELVVAPVTQATGAERDWLKASDDEIVDAALDELARLFPDEIAPGRAPDAERFAQPPEHRGAATDAAATPDKGCERDSGERGDPPAAGANGGAGRFRGPGAATVGAAAAGVEEASDGRARVRKFAVVRVPRSVYAAVPGMGKHRPSQETPVRNFFLAGDWTRQKYLGSMEGAVLAGKLAADAVSAKAAGEATPGWAKPTAPTPPPNPFQFGEPEAVEGSMGGDAGVLGDDHSGVGEAPVLSGRSPVAFGGGQAGGMAHP